ncbi:Nucleoid-associated protein [compost metagenome]
MKQMGGMLKQITQLQTRVNAAQKEIAAMEFEGGAANDLVKVRVAGTGEVKRVTFDESLKNEDLETLGDLVTVAINDAHAKKEAETKRKLGGITTGLLPMGLKLPGLGG